MGTSGVPTSYTLAVFLLLVAWDELTKNKFIDAHKLQEENKRNIDVKDSGPKSEYKTKPPFPTIPRQSAAPGGARYNCRVDGKNAYTDAFTDPMWKYQWYQHDFRTVDGPVVDHNIVPVQRMGFDGQGVTVGILGEKIVQKHPDLIGVGVFNAITRKTESLVDSPPSVGVQNLPLNVAGVVGMIANNSHCGAGIAHYAKIIGITVADGNVWDDVPVVKGLEHELVNTDIYVDAIAWAHDGMSMMFSKEIRNALKNVAYEGRRNLGAIYVKGSGDGRQDYDHCGADFIVNTIYTFVISAVDQRGVAAKYTEGCAAVIAAAYSGETLEREEKEGVVTTVEDGSCTQGFSGTTASAAIASGIFALTLQANPKLTWRDLMHLVTVSAEKAPVRSSKQWQQNGAGFWINPNFGFGLLNAENMVLEAQRWTAMPRMITCKLPFKGLGSLEGGSAHTTTTLYVSRCPSLKDADESLMYIEQVEVVTTIAFRRRGGISIGLISPKGTTSNLLNERKYDENVNGLNNWRSRSLQFWGEQPFGKWTLKIDGSHDEYNYKKTSLGMYAAMRITETVIKVATFGYIKEQVRSAELVIHGTSELPAHYEGTSAEQRRTYSYSPKALPTKLGRGKTQK